MIRPMVKTTAALPELTAMAMPAVSWQSVVLGDPLYQPFLRLDGSGAKAAPDRDFRAHAVGPEAVDLALLKRLEPGF